MAVRPRRIRQLPKAMPPKDSDVMAVSQMDADGSPVTGAMTRGEFVESLETTPGPKGDKGDKGEPGNEGQQGPQGSPGAKGEPGAIILGEVDVVDQAVVALSLGVRSKDVTIPSSWGVKTTDTLFVTAAQTLPAGYAIDNAIPRSTTSIRVYFVGPALALLASNTLRVRVAAIARA